MSFQFDKLFLTAFSIWLYITYSKMLDKHLKTETCPIIRQLFINRAARKPRMPLSWNTSPCSGELNLHHSPSLDHLWADNDTSEIHLGITSSNNGPKRSTERPETESVICQYRRHQRKRHDSRRNECQMHSTASSLKYKKLDLHL